jgi:monoamine oxidase
MKIIVLGASFAGLSTALMLSRAVHQVQVLERDGRPIPAGRSRRSDWSGPRFRRINRHPQ